ncbi:N-acetylmuramoyl-L-alanine amidase [Peribacillus deserti]|uniref:N-acetylmuramoyl-L-alanine amidase n=1 Tax=Peribacillus deserti TaxID=673318 RepID=A0ABS2QJN4_9BACI|nr:cell wall hydrolase [Peribacillus deserti]MBM7693369.1 N-acetylmuramoyl-L-alanine amidase [Peribacillus deserti]
MLRLLKIIASLALLLTITVPGSTHAEKKPSTHNRSSHTVKDDKHLRKIAKQKGVPVNLLKKKVNHSQKRNLANRFTKQEKDLLARLVNAEAKGEPYKGKVAVATVVLNRTKHKAFPKTVTGVIMEKRQFEPVSNGQINKPAASDSKRAVNEAIANHADGKGKATEAIYFYNPDLTDSKWMRSLKVVKKIGNHTFAK